MQIDFTPIINQTVTALEFSKSFTLDALRAAVHTYYDLILNQIQEFNDAQLTFEPTDPNAKDDAAKTAEEVHMGWSLSHLVLHVTASFEEGASISSILARGIPIEGRFRYEPDWRTVTTRAQVIDRISESRRMILAFLDTWPNEPHLDVYRIFPAGSRFANVQHNAPAAFLFALRHLDGHLEQFQEVARQVRAAALT